MTFHGFCPQCGTEIPRDRFVTGFAVCECGWCDLTPELQSRKKSDKHVISSMIVSSIVLVLAYAHLVSWGSYAASIPTLKLGQWTGMLSKSGYNEIADACINLGKYDCAKDAYLSLAKSKGDISGLAQYGKLSVRLNDSAGAMQAYASYFRSGGNDLESMLTYAKLLEQAGKDDDAMKYYEASIAASGEILPIIATSGNIRILMKRGQYELAYEKILAFHESAGNAKGYLNTELAQLEAKLGTQAGGKKSKAAKRVANR